MTPFCFCDDATTTMMSFKKMWIRYFRGY